jgi:hypothetical protein
MDKLALKEPLEDWSNETVELVVNAFIEQQALPSHLTNLPAALLRQVYP